MSDAPPPPKKGKLQKTKESESKNGNEPQASSSRNDATDDFVFKVPTSPAPRRKKPSTSTTQAVESSSATVADVEQNVRPTDFEEPMEVDVQEVPEADSIPESPSSVQFSNALEGENDPQNPSTASANKRPSVCDSSTDSDSEFVYIRPKRLRNQNFVTYHEFKSALYKIETIMNKLPAPGTSLNAYDHDNINNIFLESLPCLPKYLKRMVDELVIKFNSLLKSGLKNIRKSDQLIQPRQRNVATDSTSIAPDDAQNGLDLPNPPADINLIVEDDSIRPNVVEPAVDFPETNEEEFDEALRVLEEAIGEEPSSNLTTEIRNGMQTRNEGANSLPNFRRVTNHDSIPSTSRDSSIRTPLSSLRAEMDSASIIANFGFNDDELLTLPDLDSNVSLPMNEQIVAPDVNLDVPAVPPITPDAGLRSTLAITSTPLPAPGTTPTTPKEQGRKKNVLRRSTMINTGRVDEVRRDAMKNSGILYSSPPEETNDLGLQALELVDFSFITAETYDAIHRPWINAMRDSLAKNSDSVPQGNVPATLGTLDAQNANDNHAFSATRTNDTTEEMRQEMSNTTIQALLLTNESVDEFLAQLDEQSSRNAQTIQRISSPQIVPRMELLNYDLDDGIFSRGSSLLEANPDGLALLAEIEELMGTGDRISFQTLRPVETTTTFEAARTFAILLKLYAEKKVLIEQKSSSPKDIIIIKK